jgi:ABC-type lipoprotein release transport system permease subunit
MRFLCALSIGGVAAGVMVLMITMSVMSGFLVEVQKLIRGVHADLEFLSQDQNTSFVDREKYLKGISPKIQAISPHLEREVLVCSDEEKWAGGILIGIDFMREVQTTQLMNFLYTPYKQIWDQFRQFSREKKPLEWKALAFQKENAGKKLYVEVLQGKNSSFLRLQFNEKNQVRDYSTFFEPPSVSDAIPEEMTQWVSQQNQAYQQGKIEIFMKSFLKEVTYNERGFDLKNPFDSKGLSSPPLIVGEAFMQKLKLDPSQTHEVSLMSAQQVYYEHETEVVEYKQKFTIVGLFKSGLYEVDSNRLYAPIQEVQHFLKRLPYRYNSIYLQIEEQNEKELEAVQQELIQKTGNSRIYTWRDHKKNLLRVVQLQKNVVSIILFFIVLMASATVLFILLQLVFERKQDIGILKSMGASTFGIFSIFLLYGFIIGILGVLLGLSCGYLVLDRVNDISDFIYETFGREIFPRNIYHLNEIPTDIQFYDILLVTLPTVLVSIFFSLPAAYLAARQNPVENLQSK